MSSHWIRSLMGFCWPSHTRTGEKEQEGETDPTRAADFTAVTELWQGCDRAVAELWQPSRQKQFKPVPGSTFLASWKMLLVGQHGMENRRGWDTAVVGHGWGGFFFMGCGFAALGWEGALLGFLLSCSTEPGRHQSFHLFVSHFGHDFKGKTLLCGPGAVSGMSNMPCPLSRSFHWWVLKYFAERSEVLSSFNERGTITHFALGISLPLLFCYWSPCNSNEIPSTQIYLWGRMLERWQNDSAGWRPVTGAEQQLSQPEECFVSLFLLFFVCLCVQQSTLLSSVCPDAMLFLFKIPTSDFPFGFCFGFFFFSFLLPQLF